MTTNENIVLLEKIWVYAAYLKEAEPDKHCQKVKKGKGHILSVKADQLSLSEKINAFMECVEEQEGLHSWKKTT